MAGEIVAFTYNEVDVRQNDRTMVNLTDMWRTHGCPESQRPAQWLRLPNTVRFIDALCRQENVGKSHILDASRGRDKGSYAHWQIALAYATCLSPEFHLHVNKVYRAWVEGTLQPKFQLSWLLRATQWRDSLSNLTMCHEPDYYCGMMVITSAMGTVEEEILNHELQTYESDRMDGSFGYHWGKHHAKLLAAKPGLAPERKTNPKITLEYDVNGKKVNIRPWLYHNDTYSDCRSFFRKVYVPFLLPDYLKNKMTLKDADPVVKYSIAENVAQRLICDHAAIPEEHRRIIEGYHRLGVKRITASMRAKHQLENQQGKLFE